MNGSRPDLAQTCMNMRSSSSLQPLATVRFTRSICSRLQPGAVGSGMMRSVMRVLLPPPQGDALLTRGLGVGRQAAVVVLADHQRQRPAGLVAETVIGGRPGVVVSRGTTAGGVRHGGRPRPS